MAAGCVCPACSGVCVPLRVRGAAEEAGPGAQRGCPAPGGRHRAEQAAHRASVQVQRPRAPRGCHHRPARVQILLGLPPCHVGPLAWTEMPRRRAAAGGLRCSRRSCISGLHCLRAPVRFPRLTPCPAAGSFRKCSRGRHILLRSQDTVSGSPDRGSHVRAGPAPVHFCGRPLLTAGGSGEAGRWTEPATGGSGVALTPGPARGRESSSEDRAGHRPALRERQAPGKTGAEDTPGCGVGPPPQAERGGGAPGRRVLAGKGWNGASAT